MSKIDLLSSNNSRSSSETSETISVEENILAGGNESRTSTPQTSNLLVDRSTRKSKRMKDANNDKDSEKRPPWRAVSISTLPKPDKNALLKAKLLDASRRMRSGKVSTSVQTDIVPTKLMKEANFGVQVDLILFREAGIMTDGSYMKKKQGNDEFVLTYSVSTVTDAIQYANASTQTLLPKIPEDTFMSGYSESDIGSLASDKFNELQRKLLQQISKVRKASNLRGSEHSSYQDLQSEETYLFKENENQTIDHNFNKPSLLSEATLQSWHFELDEIGNDSSNFQPYTISANRPWNSFVPLCYNGFYSDYMGPQRLDWNILFLAIDELIQESNCLVDIIEDLTKPKKYKVIEIPKLETNTQQLPSEYWLPIIEQQEKKLESMKKNMRNSLNE